MRRKQFQNKLRQVFYKRSVKEEGTSKFSEQLSELDEQLEKEINKLLGRKPPKE